MAFVVPGRGGRVVTRAKKLMSAFMRGQGSVPFRPIPRRVFSRVGIGVVATIRVRGFVGGIFGWFGGVVRGWLLFLGWVVLGWEVGRFLGCGKA